MIIQDDGFKIVIKYWGARFLFSGSDDCPSPPFELKGEAIFSLVNIIYMMAGNNNLKKSVRFYPI